MRPLIGKFSTARCGLRAVVGVGRHAHLAERIALDADRRRRAGRLLPRIHRHFQLNYTARMLPSFFDSVVALITRTSTDLPPDVRQAMGLALATEEPATRAGQALTIIAQNIDQAASCEGPICQDTGMPTFEVQVPVGANQIWMKQQIRAAVAEATRRGKLRPELRRLDHRRELRQQPRARARRSSTSSSGSSDDIEVKLILKGGGCENTNAQYSLPAELDHLGRADRTLDGVRKCILHAVWKAQGKGCSPGAVGVCIGGDRTSGYLHAKEQLFRTLDDTNPDPRLAELEASIMDDGQQAHRRADGLRRKDVAHRLQDLARSTACPPASSCRSPTTAGRFAALASGSTRATGAITSWLYRDGDDGVGADAVAEEPAAGFPRTGREVRLQRADLRRADPRAARSATSC